MTNLGQNQNRIQDKNAYEYLVKVLVVGDSGVGKTALITRYTESHFIPSYTATIGVDFKAKLVDINN
jgi:GTPase SAR1 family protein